MTTITPEPPPDEPGDDATTDDILRWVGRRMGNLADVVVDERQGRRTTNRLAVVVIVAIIVGALVTAGAVLFTLNRRVDKLDKQAITCESRAQARADARSGLVRIADHLAKDNPRYPTAAAKAKQHAEAVKIARDAYPELVCSG